MEDTRTSAADTLEPLLIELRRVQTPKPRPHVVTWAAIFALVPLYIWVLTMAYQAGNRDTRLLAVEQWRVSMETTGVAIAEMRAELRAIREEQARMYRLIEQRDRFAQPTPGRTP